MSMIFINDIRQFSGASKTSLVTRIIFAGPHCPGYTLNNIKLLEKYFNLNKLY